MLSEELKRQEIFEALNDGCCRALLSGPDEHLKPVRVVCVVPVLPSELRLDVLRSIASQTMPVSHIALLTVKAPDMPFPAKISWVINDYLSGLKLEQFDYLLRVDADTVLPPDFVEANIKGDFAVQGYGCAQLIRVKDFFECMGGRLFAYHDDGYPLVKLSQCGKKVTSGYFAVDPLVMRNPGFHQGYKWFVSQGELHYRYGYDVLHELLDFVFKFKSYHPYGVFLLFGYFKALLSRECLFDVAGPIRWRHQRIYCEPKRFLRLGVYVNQYLRNKI